MCKPVFRNDYSLPWDGTYSPISLFATLTLAILMRGERVTKAQKSPALWISYAFVAIVLLVAPVANVYATDFPVADKVVVDKGNRVLHLMDKGVAFRTFKIALGLVPEGDKEQEGDQKTPEGNYMLGGRNPNSDFFLSIHVSYPNNSERSIARAKGTDPGGEIMIHGQPNSPTYSAAYYARADWTNGCIAVSNSDMIDIWLMTPNRVPIEIIP